MNDLKGIFIGSIFGILGAVIGAWVNGLMNSHVQNEQQRMKIAIESFKFDSGNYPPGFLDIKQLIDEAQNLSMVNAKAISRLAEIQKRFPGCGSELSERCRPAFIQTILVMRDQLGSEKVSAEDIDVIILNKYIKAEQSLKQFGPKMQ